MSKTNLQKILSISGHKGLFLFIAQAKAGVIAESLINGKRNMFGINERVTSLADISIYTEEDEVSLAEVLGKMKEYLGDGTAPDPKGGAEILKDFFSQVLPDYDKDRFYVSHMKKVVEWYNILKEKASLEFEDHENAEESDIVAG